MVKPKSIKVLSQTVAVQKINEDDFICLTDIARYRDVERGDYIIQNWMRNRNTIEFLGIWEQLNNPSFNSIEFDGIKTQAGLNSFSLTPKRWIKQTGAIGVIAKTGRYGGTFAHKDIAFEFASWVSVEFKLYLIKEFQRLKEIEQEQLGWDIKRNMENLNAHFIKQGMKQPERLSTLNRIAIEQMALLTEDRHIKRLER